MEEDGEIKTPFWEQSTTDLRRVDRFNRRLSSLIFSSGVLLFFLLVTAIFFMIFVIPTNLSFSSHIFRPKSVMKSWDSVNLVLVLVALFFGFLSKNKNNDFDSIVSSNVVEKSEPLTPNKLYGNYSDRPDFRNFSGGLRRNSVSYPDFQLRDQLSAGEYDRWRYYDDTDVDSYRIVESDRPVYYRRRSWKEYDRPEFEVKNVYVDNAFNSKVDEEKEETFSDPPISSPPPPPPPPPPPRRPTAEKKGKRIYRNLAYEQETSSFTVFSPASPSPPPPPPPPPQRRTAEQKGKRMSRSHAYEQETSKDVGIVESGLTPDTITPPAPVKELPENSGGSYYKKRNGGNAGKDHNFLSSFYQTKKKKKRQRQRSIDNLDAFFNESELPQNYKPPPPPPPPPYSVLHNLFSTKKGKRRRIPSDPHPLLPNSPPPPPPPPPQFKAARVSKPLKIQSPLTTYKTPTPIKIKSFNSIDDNSSSGGSSPLPSIPPPPPPPPFKMPEWKYIVEGDYVSIQSNPSSRSGSPDTDDAGNNSPETHTTSSQAFLFCPSPDVDTKADNFIARFRAGLKLEKIDSFNKKQGSRLSNLGPGCGPSQN